MTKNMIGTPNEKTLRQRQLWIAWGLSAVSGGLIAASMPNFDMHILGWVALVPLLLAIQYMPDKSAFILALPFGLIWSIAVTPEMSQALFDVNAELTRQVAGQGAAFVVWPENEFADADDRLFIGQVGTLAQQMGAYIVADVVWRAATGMYDAALLVGPDGKEVGRRAKIYIMPDEKQYGFVAGPNQFPVYDTPYGKVGIAVCVDRHRLWITRELARAGAQIVLMPVDDDYNHNSRFLPFHAADGVFRSVENRGYLWPGGG